MSKSIEDKERKAIKELIEQEKARERQDAQETAVMDRLVAGTVDTYNNAKAPASPPQAAARPISAITNTISVQTDRDEKAEEKVFPQFEEQLKEIRQGFAKQYEDKMNRGF